MTLHSQSHESPKPLWLESQFSLLACLWLCSKEKSIRLNKSTWNNISLIKQVPPGFYDFLHWQNNSPALRQDGGRYEMASLMARFPSYLVTAFSPNSNSWLDVKQEHNWVFTGNSVGCKMMKQFSSLNELTPMVENF